jgi:2-phospho-L-lactate guanylyltransferase (CobY/MobA/RfbA family)
MKRQLLILALAVTPAAAQDIRGLEVCTAEKTMERRTSCLQSNVEFLQQALAKVSRETRDRLNAASHEMAAQKTEIGALKADLAKLQHELLELKKAKPEKNKPEKNKPEKK